MSGHHGGHTYHELQAPVLGLALGGFTASEGHSKTRGSSHVDMQTVCQQALLCTQNVATLAASTCVSGCHGNMQNGYCWVILGAFLNASYVKKPLRTKRRRLRNLFCPKGLDCTRVRKPKTVRNLSECLEQSFFLQAPKVIPKPWS